MSKMSKKIHPDIVVGEPIPEIEPRVNEELADHMRRFNRRSRIFVPSIIALAILLLVTGFNLVIQVLILFFVILLWLIPLSRNERKLRRSSDEPGTRLQSNVPFRVGFEYTLYTTLVGFPTLFLLDMKMFAIGFGLIIVGALLIVARFWWREPGQICCVDCEYPLTGLTLPCDCPECSQRIYDGSWTTDRVRVKSDWFLPSGMLAIVMGLGLLVTNIMRPGLLMVPMPRGVLVKMAAKDDGAFDRLTGSPMSREEEQELIENMYQIVMQGGRLRMFKQGEWFAKQVFKGGLSDEQLAAMLDHAVDEGIDVQIDAPDHVWVGDSVELKLKSKRLMMPDSALYPSYYFRGFVLGDDPAFYAQSVTGKHHFKLSQGNWSNDPQSLDSPHYVFSASEPGGLVVRCRVVWVLFPNFNVQYSAGFAWDEDGEPSFETQPIWSRVVDIEHRIVVEDRGG